MTLPARYGQGAGPYRLIPGDTLEVSFEETGLNLSKSPLILGDGESPDLLDVQLWEGGIASDYAFSLLGTRFSGANDEIIGIFEFQRKNLSVVLVRVRPTAWDRWNGTTWVTLTGAVGGLSSHRPQAVVMQDKFVVAMANLTDKLKVWDGADVTAIADLSADSPIAKFIAPMGQRLVAAVIKSGADFDPYLVKWSADGNITDWTNANNGAGTTLLEPEGKSGSPELINGLSALEIALVLYRSRSIVLGTRTGVGAQPFRFNTVVFGLGTDSPQSIANVGASVGDIFLGSDLNVYLFDGHRLPVPIGDPIWKALRSQVNDPAKCYSMVDRRFGKYWLMTPLGGSLTPDYAWVFNIRKYLESGKLSWYKRFIGSGFLTLGFGNTTAGVNPVVNTVTSVVNTVNTIVNEYSSTATPQRLLIGDDNGGVSYLDTGVVIPGYFHTKDFGSLEDETRLDRLHIHYIAPGTATIEVSVSTDGGNTFSGLVSLSLATAPGGGVKSTSIPIVANRYRYKLRIVSGYVVITNLTAKRYGAGRAVVTS